MTNKLNSRFVFSISDETRYQLEHISSVQECSSAAMIRKLIRDEYRRHTRTSVSDTPHPLSKPIK